MKVHKASYSIILHVLEDEIKLLQTGCVIM